MNTIRILFLGAMFPYMILWQILLGRQSAFYFTCINMIEVEKLCVSLNDREILVDISFTLNNGNNLVILGRSGSGKTV